MNITKKVAAAALAALLGASAQAGIDVTWRADGGFFQIDGITPLLVNVGDSAVVQLINAGINGVIDPVNAVNPNYLGGDDSLIATITFQNTGSDGFNEYAAVQYGVWQNATFSSLTFYGRIFQDATPTAGERYFDGATATTQNKGIGETQIYDFNGGNLAGNTLPNVIAVPEPATFAFLGIGGILAAVRRMRRS